MTCSEDMAASNQGRVVFRLPGARADSVDYEEVDSHRSSNVQPVSVSKCFMTLASSLFTSLTSVALKEKRDFFLGHRLSTTSHTLLHYSKTQLSRDVFTGSFHISNNNLYHLFRCGGVMCA